MKTYLFIWNPDKWVWKNLEQNIEQLENAGKVTVPWSVASHKAIQLGDRAFLARVGVDPRGIFAAGVVSSIPFVSKHWNVNVEDKDIHRVMIDFDVLLNSDNEPILGIDILKTGNLIKQNWTPQSSGISIKPEITDELEAVWFDFLTTENIRYNPFMPSNNFNEDSYTEGAANQITLTRYERNPYARKACIDHYGYSCVVCDFNFEKKYGLVGKDFIHVHHLTQIAGIGKSHSIDPIIDLRPVCPNCHAIIHKKKMGYNIEEVKDFINRH